MSNLSAFQDTIAHSEGTDKADDPYRCVYGFEHTIADLSDHPAVTGEWLGTQTKWGHTSAAGKYQLEKATWLGCKAQLNLPDFGPVSQDAAATLLIKQKGALDMVEGGQFSEAVERCHEVWASLPGNSSGQPQNSMASLVAAYAAAGGGYA